VNLKKLTYIITKITKSRAGEKGRVMQRFPSRVIKRKRKISVIEASEIDVLSRLNEIGLFDKRNKKRSDNKDWSKRSKMSKRSDKGDESTLQKAVAFVPIVTRSLKAPDVPVVKEQDPFGELFNKSMAIVRHNLEATTCPMYDMSRTSYNQQLLMQTVDGTATGTMKYLVRPKSSATARMITRGGKNLCREPHDEESVSPGWPMRMNYMNGGHFVDKHGNSCSYNAHFPFTMWSDVFERRAKDIRKSIPFFDNDAAYSGQGICCFFEMDYRSAMTFMSEGEMMKHAIICQDVLKEYYCSNKNVDYSMWVLFCLPKPKMNTELDRLLIASGMHIVFPNIVINSERGIQLSASVAHRIQMKHGYVNVVDTNIFKPNSDMVTLRPAYSRKADKCPRCLGRPEERTHRICTLCANDKRVGCGSMYIPTHLVKSDGVLTPNHIIEDMCEHKLKQVLIDTSIVPPTDTGDFTLGYIVPPGATDPETTRAINPEGYKKTKTNGKQKKPPTNKLVKGNMNLVTDQHILEVLTLVIRSFRVEHKYASIRSASASSNMYLVNLSSGGHKFCRIADEKGKHHNSNSILFRISLKAGTITQHCYDQDCRKLLAGNPEIKKRVTSLAHEHHLQAIFPDQPPSLITTLNVEENATRLKQDSSKCVVALSKKDVSGSYRALMAD